jgi:hypothetical protein
MHHASMHVLPVRVKPAVWEDLPSFVRRCSAHMGYEQPEWILSPEKSDWRMAASRLPRLRYQRDYDVLGCLLNVEEEALYRLTVHRFAPLLSQRESRTVQEIDRPLVAASPYVSAHLFVSVCPSCIAEPESYDRLYWRLPLALVCPRHGQVLRHMCPHCQHPIKSLRAHAYRCVFCSQGDYRKEVARALGPSSALLDASRWMLQLAGVEGEELGTSSRGAMSTPERLKGMSTRQIFMLLESVTSVFTLSYTWNELREMCEVWGMLTQRDREILNQQSESQKLLVVLFFLGLFGNWPRQFESWLEEVFDAARIYGREKELMEGYQERMRQELFRDPYKEIEAQYQSYAVEWIKTKGGGHGLGINGRFDTMVERMKRYGLVSHARCDWTGHHCAWSQGM